MWPKPTPLVTIERQAGIRYRWRVWKVALSRVANVERKMPKSFITRDGYGITAAGLNYLKPLIQGEDYPPYKEGLPEYVRLKNQLVPKKLPKFKMP